MNGLTRHPKDDLWQFVRCPLAITGAILFVVAGAKMTGIHSEASLSANTTTAEVFYQGMGLVSYGLAVVCLLVGLPSRLAAPPADEADAVATEEPA